jgi:hypothetical protein
MLRNATIVIFAAFVSGTSAIAGPCPSYSNHRERLPPLLGYVNDSTYHLLTQWESTAFTNGRTDAYGGWQIENFIHNGGQKNVVVSWPKAGIYIDAFYALPPNGCYSNLISAGPSQPRTDPDSPITLGYQGQVVAR